VRRLALLGVGLVAAAYFASFLSYGIYLEDEGLLLHQIGRTARGETPFVDFHTGYTPGTFYLNAGLFRLFGESVRPLRAALVPVNGAAIVLLFALARPLAGGLLAAVAALGYMAFLPFFVGDFASFNIPYPTWYAGAAWLATQAAFDRYLARGSRTALVLAGVFAGIAFSFKQNAGLLAVLACGLTLSLISAGDGDDDRTLARLLIVLGGLALVVLLGLDVLSLTAVLILAAPLTLIVGRLVRARGRWPHAGRLHAAVALVAAGAAAPVVPWAVYFLWRLGPRGFVHDVLLVGARYEIIYETAYPMPSGLTSWWPLLAALGMTGVGALGLAAERGAVRIRPAAGCLGLAAVLVAGLAARGARMPEGVARSIVWQALYVGFYAIPLLGFFTTCYVLRRLGETGNGSLPSSRRLLGVLVFALCMYVELYPRVDTMHLIGAMPSALVLAAAAASRLACAWGAALRISRSLARAAVVAPAVVLAALAAIPNYAGLLRLQDTGLAAEPQLWLDSSRAPVHVEAARSEELRALNGVLGHLRMRLRPDEAVFAYPAAALVPFALGHPTPTPHDYFFPGRPDHRAEAEVVRVLEARPPRFIVTLNRRLGFFSESSAYYFILLRHLRQHYALDARFGRYDVLARRATSRRALVVEVPPIDGTPATWRAGLADPDREIRRASVHAFLAAAGGAGGVSQLARAWAPDEATQLLLVRNLGEAGDGRAVEFLMSGVETGSARLTNEACVALNLLALRERSDRHLVASGGEPGLLEGADPPAARLRAWLADRRLRKQVGIFAAHALARAEDRAAIPAVETLVRAAPRGSLLQVVALEALVELGQPERLCDLVALLGVEKHDVQDGVPSFLVDAAAVHPAELGPCLARGLAASAPLARELAAWVSGSAGLSGMTPALRQALTDPVPGVRMAAGWALGMLHDQEARPALVALAEDPDPEMRGFAREALGRLGDPAWPAS